MAPERTSKWNDSRLDEAFETLRDEVRALRDIPSKLAELAVEMGYVKADTHACHQAVRELRDDFTAYTEEQGKAHEAHRLERKSDRRWMVGTVLTAAGLVIAAVGLLAGNF